MFRPKCRARGIYGATWKLIRPASGPWFIRQTLRCLLFLAVLFFVSPGVVMNFTILVRFLDRFGKDFGNWDCRAKTSM